MISHALEHLPFSMAGTFLTIARESGSPRLVYRTVSARARSDDSSVGDAADFFEIALLGEAGELPYTATAQPHRLDLKCESGGEATLVFADADTLHFEVKGVSLQLIGCKPFQEQYSPASGYLCLLDAAARGVHQFRACPGQGLSAGMEGERVTVTFSGGGAIRFNRYETRWEKSLAEFKDLLEDREKEYARWQKHQPAAPERYQEAAELAWLTLWLCQVPAQGALTRRAIYMSKSGMNAIWSWDNCFTALAVAKADPELAYDQLMLFFDHQEPHGMIPDQVTDLEAFSATPSRPSRAGLCCGSTERLGSKKSLNRIENLYKPLANLTEWWYRYRDYDDDGLCQYHHGNDSGWDNATVFDAGMPVESADLPLTWCCKTRVSPYWPKRCGRNSLAALERARRRAIEELLKQGTRSTAFVHPWTGTATTHPKPIADQLHAHDPGQPAAWQSAQGTGGRPVAWRAIPHRVRPGFGSASQSKVPIRWLLARPGVGRAELHDLRRAGGSRREALARTIAERFCELCLRSPGFWENYDALSGQGLRCPGYTWTAAIFLLFAGWLEKNQKVEG